jgi:hypothetical protein
MLRKALIITTLLAPFNNVFAGAIDFRVGSDAAELTFLTQNATFGYGGADIGFGVLINEEDDFIANASILVSGSSKGDVKGLHFGVGVKAYAGSLDGPAAVSLDVNGGAIAIGGRIRYILPGKVPVAVLAEAYFAPDITNISDFDGLIEYRIALELEITPSALAYIGYRKLEVTFNDNVEYDVDDSAHVGVRFEF